MPAIMHCDPMPAPACWMERWSELPIIWCQHARCTLPTGGPRTRMPSWGPNNVTPATLHCDAVPTLTSCPPQPVSQNAPPQWQWQLCVLSRCFSSLSLSPRPPSLWQRPPLPHSHQRHRRACSHRHFSCQPSRRSTSHPPLFLSAGLHLSKKKSKKDRPKKDAVADGRGIAVLLRPASCPARGPSSPPMASRHMVRGRTTRARTRRVVHRP